MKMVSAAKLRRAQDAITQMRPYAEKLKELLSNLSESTESSSENGYTEVREVERVLMVCITSNRGLAGAFNSSVIKEANRRIKEEYAGKDVTILAIGKKADDFFKKTTFYSKGSALPTGLHYLYDDLNFEDVAEVAGKVMQSYVSGQFDKVEIVYNEFVNAAIQKVNVEQYLPILPPEKQENQKDQKNLIHKRQESAKQFLQ